MQVRVCLYASVCEGERERERVSVRVRERVVGGGEEGERYTH